MNGKKTETLLSFVLQSYLFGNSPQEIEDIFEKGSSDTNRNANFAQNLFWDLACFLQGLIQGAAILHNFFGRKYIQQLLLYSNYKIKGSEGIL